MNAFPVRNNKSKNLQKNTNNSNTSANSPVILGKKTRRKPNTNVRKPVNRRNLRIAQLLRRKQNLESQIQNLESQIQNLQSQIQNRQKDKRIINAAIRVLNARK